MLGEYFKIIVNTQKCPKVGFAGFKQIETLHSHLHYQNEHSMKVSTCAIPYGAQKTFVNVEIIHQIGGSGEALGEAIKLLLYISLAFINPNNF